MKSLLAALVLLLSAASAARAEGIPEPSRGETVYVPVYSHIWHGNLDDKSRPMMLLLSSMLSIRNTDPASGITIHSVRYYDTDGKLLREFPQAARKLAPLGSSDVFVEQKDSAGGTGANFLVVWSADKPVNPPIIETVNAYFFGPHSLAFTSPGRAIRVEK